jgi:uncharacterized membrane protein
VKKRLPLVVRHVLYNLRGGFLVRPLAIALSLGLAGGAASWWEQAHPLAARWLPPVLFPSHADPVVAQVILGGIAASMMTVVSIVFAILLMTLTLASMQFSPRIIVSFSTDRVTQRTLGMFLGTFCYCTAALPAARAVPRPFAPVLTVAGAMGLAVVCVAGLLFFIHHISHAISVNYIVDRIAAETEAVIDTIMPAARRVSRMDPQPPMAGVEWDAAVLAVETGYVRFVDVNRLYALARSYRVKVQLVRRVGHFVPAGTPVLRVCHGDRLTPEAHAKFRGALDVGPARTLQQDVEFGVLQIVDIALKAISPAVNDPSTAICCVDQLSRILIRYAQREPPAAVLYDLPGQPRLGIAWVTFDGLLRSAFDQIRHYAKADVVVCLRMIRALDDVVTTTSDPTYHRSLRACGEKILADCSPLMTEQDVAPLRQRMRSLERSVDAQAARPDPPARGAGGPTLARPLG